METNVITLQDIFFKPRDEEHEIRPVGTCPC